MPARLCQRVAFSIFLCFFLRMRFRRFLINDPMACGRLAARPPRRQVASAPGATRARYRGGGPGVEVSMGFRLLGLDLVQLAMPRGEEDLAERFYCGQLGLERLPKPQPLAARGGCWFSNGPVVLHLGVEDEFRAARKAHPALVVDDLGALRAQLESAGYDVRPDDELPGVERCYVDDPFGNRIELIQSS